MGYFVAFVVAEEYICFAGELDSSIMDQSLIPMEH